MNLLADNRRILKSTAWNFFGQGVPLVAALVSFPILLRNLGVEGFGFFLLAWSVLGYFSMLDFGMGRATTRLAALDDDSNPDQTRALVSSAVSFLAMAGIGLALFCPLVAWQIRHAHVVEGALAKAVSSDFFWATCTLAIAVPMLTLTAAVRGVLEGKRLFREVALVRIVTGTLMCALPAVMSFAYATPLAVSIALVVARLVALLAFVVLERAQVHLIDWGKRPTMIALREIAPFSFWVSISNAAGTAIVYMDRFIVSALIGLAAVTYYATAFEVVSRLLVIPGALVTTLFPLVARTNNFEMVWTGITRMYRLCAVLVIPISIVAFACVHWALELWVGNEFADASSSSVRILLIGLGFNSLAHIPFYALQALGRAKLPALAHLIELPIFFVVAWQLTRRYGIEGAAASWTLRAGIDLLVMHLLLRLTTAYVPRLRTVQ